MARFSLKQVFGSPEKKLDSFRFKKVTKTKFLNSTNGLVLLEDEETVIGVLSAGHYSYSRIIHNNYHV